MVIFQTGSVLRLVLFGFGRVVGRVFVGFCVARAKTPRRPGPYPERRLTVPCGRERGGER